MTLCPFFSIIEWFYGIIYEVKKMIQAGEALDEYNWIDNIHGGHGIIDCRLYKYACHQDAVPSL